MALTFKQIEDRASLRDAAGFEFKWDMPDSPNTITVSNVIDGRSVALAEYEHVPEDLYNYLHLLEVIPEYRGTEVAGQMLAYVAWDSVVNGFEGFVAFEPKTLIYNYYIAKYGARPLVGRKLFFGTEASVNLIHRYLGGDYVKDIETYL
ncbi:MAG: hypothetical protein LBL86_04340 [Coriobacteriales bacterium]|nr:hypothetical protein [Coriobacteriales bacterium]